MANKTFILSLVAIFAALFLLSFASAVSLDNFTITAPSSTTHNAGSFPISFTLVNDGVAGTINLSSQMSTEQQLSLYQIL